MAENVVNSRCADSELKGVLRERLTGRVVDEIRNVEGSRNLPEVEVKQRVAMFLPLIFRECEASVLTLAPIDDFKSLGRDVELYELVELRAMFSLFTDIMNPCRVIVEVEVLHINHVNASEIIREHEEVFGKSLTFRGRLIVPDRPYLINREPRLAYLSLWQLIAEERINAILNISAPLGVVQEHHKEHEPIADC